MPTPFMCHSCDSFTMNSNGLCDECHAKYHPEKTTNDEVLDLVSERLYIGQTRYKGDIPMTGEKGRDNLKEALEEVLDLAVYLAAEIISIKDKRDK